MIRYVQIKPESIVQVLAIKLIARYLRKKPSMVLAIIFNGIHQKQENCFDISLTQWSDIQVFQSGERTLAESLDIPIASMAASSFSESLSGDLTLKDNSNTGQWRSMVVH